MAQVRVTVADNSVLAGSPSWLCQEDLILSRRTSRSRAWGGILSRGTWGEAGLGAREEGLGVPPSLLPPWLAEAAGF